MYLLLVPLCSTWELPWRSISFSWLSSLKRVIKHILYLNMCVYICMHMYSHVSVSQIHCVQNCLLIAAPFYQFPLDHRKYIVSPKRKWTFEIACQWANAGCLWQWCCVAGTFKLHFHTRHIMPLHLVELRGLEWTCV